MSYICSHSAPLQFSSASSSLSRLQFLFVSLPHSSLHHVLKKRPQAQRQPPPKPRSRRPASLSCPPGRTPRSARSPDLSPRPPLRAHRFKKNYLFRPSSSASQNWRTRTTPSAQLSTCPPPIAPSSARAPRARTNPSRILPLARATRRAPPSLPRRPAAVALLPSPHRPPGQTPFPPRPSRLICARPRTLAIMSMLARGISTCSSATTKPSRTLLPHLPAIPYRVSTPTSLRNRNTRSPAPLPPAIPCLIRCTSLRSNRAPKTSRTRLTVPWETHTATRAILFVISARSRSTSHTLSRRFRPPMAVNGITTLPRRLPSTLCTLRRVITRGPFRMGMGIGAPAMSPRAIRTSSTITILTCHRPSPLPARCDASPRHAYLISPTRPYVLLSVMAGIDQIRPFDLSASRDCKCTAPFPRTRTHLVPTLSSLQASRAPLPLGCFLYHYSLEQALTFPLCCFTSRGRLQRYSCPNGSL